MTGSEIYIKLENKEEISATKNLDVSLKSFGINRFSNLSIQLKAIRLRADKTYGTQFEDRFISLGKEGEVSLVMLKQLIVEKHGEDMYPFSLFRDGEFLDDKAMIKCDDELDVMPI